MKRSPMRQQAANRKKSLVEFGEDVRSTVRRRAFGRCEVKAPGCRDGIHHYHHRLLRSHGGSGTLENCLGVCGPCHATIHANPDWAYRHGLLVRAFNQPDAVNWFNGCGPGCDENHAGQ
jgi:hypothetical protein